MKLQDWLTLKNLTVNRFARYQGLCKESIYKYIKGQVPRSEVARKIVKATAGEVSFEDLGLSAQAIAKIKLKQQKLRAKMDKEKAKRDAERLKKQMSVNG